MPTKRKTKGQSKRATRRPGPVAPATVSMPGDVPLKPIENLLPYAQNPRGHSKQQVEKIAASIKEFGFNNPVLIDPDGEIIAGHGRLLAARKLDLEMAPVITLAHLTEAQKRAYRIADNRLAEDASWNDQFLRFEIDALRGLQFDVTLTGFDLDEIARLFDRGSQPVPGEDDIPEAPAEATTVPGDIWQLGRHRLRCGDSTKDADVVALLADVEPHLMVTDPPYGVNYNPKWRADAGVNKNREKMGKVGNDDRVDWGEAWALFPGNVAYVWHAGRFAAQVQESLEDAGFEIRCQIIWAKSHPALSRGHYHWQHEPCWYAVRKGSTAHWSGDRTQTTLWPINSREDSGHGHGTQKPVEAMRRPILNNSRQGETVYDPFLGSGSTIIAAETTGRSCYAMEIDPIYCDVAIRRWEEFTGSKAEKVTS